MPNNATITSVPLLDLNAQYDSIREEIKEAVNKVLESQYFIMGPEVKDFEKGVAEYCNVSHAIGCASGSDALLLSLMALEVGPGDGVITTPYTFFATAGAVARVGATPIFLDIDPISYNLNSNQLEAFLEKKHPLNKKINIDKVNLKAIIPVHLYGQMANMNPIKEMAKTHGLAVIEDAAQAIGSEYKAKRAGSISDFGCFSFFPSKNLGGFGDGGLVTTDDAEMAEKLSMLRLHGAKPKYHHKIVGINSRLDTLQAAVLQVKLKYLDDWSEQRRNKALNYNKLFREAGLAGDSDELNNLGLCCQAGEASCELDKHPGKVFLPIEQEGDPEKGGRHIYHQYVIRTGGRGKIIEALDENDIGHSVYYPVPLHEQECFKYLGYQSSDCPVSSCASRTTLALPIYPELESSAQEHIVEVIKGAISK